MPIVQKATFDIQVDWNDTGNFQQKDANILTGHYSDHDFTYGLDISSDPHSFRFSPARGSVVCDNANNVFNPDIAVFGRTITPTQLRAKHAVRITEVLPDERKILLFEGIIYPPEIQPRVGFSIASFELEGKSAAILQTQLEIVENQASLADLLAKAEEHFDQNNAPVPYLDDVESGAMKYSGSLVNYLQDLMRFGGGYAFEDHRGRLGFYSVTATRFNKPVDYTIDAENFLIDAEGTHTEILSEIIANEATVIIQEVEGTGATTEGEPTKIGEINNLEVPAGTTVVKRVIVRTPTQGQTWRWQLKPPVLTARDNDISPPGTTGLSIAYETATALTSVAVTVSNATFTDKTIGKITIEAWPIDYSRTEEEPLEETGSKAVYGTRRVTFPEWFALDQLPRASATLKHLSDPLLGARVRIPMWQETLENTAIVGEIKVGDLVRFSFIDSRNVQIQNDMLVLQVRTFHNYKRMPRKELVCVATFSIGQSGATTWGTAEWGTAKWRGS